MLEMIVQHYWVIMLFFIIATLYSSVGFGGGSSYLAVLALTTLAYTQIRSTALLCNIMVVSGNVLVFINQQQYNWRRALPLVLVSVPFAFLGGFLKLDENFFFIILGVTLLFAAATMWFSQKISASNNTYTSSGLKNGLIGSAIGFLSGLVGIGGGIFLAPFLHLNHWDRPTKIAAVSSLFILVNSISGFMGQVMNNDFEMDWSLTTIFLCTVLLGSLVGNRLRNSMFSPNTLKKVTALLVAFVGIRILYNYFFLY